MPHYLFVCFCFAISNTDTVTNYHKLGCLKQQKCNLLVLEVRSLKSRCQQGHGLSEGSREESFFASSQLLVAPGSPWCSLAWLLHSNICLCLHMTSTDPTCVATISNRRCKLFPTFRLSSVVVCTTSWYSR